MRTTTTAQDDALAALDRTTFARVLIEDPDGVLTDVTDLQDVDWLDEVVIDFNEDDPISSAQITLWRDQGSLSLAPLMEGSVINRDSGASYAPFINPAREVVVYTTTLEAGDTPTSGDWVLLWRGTIDDPEWGGSGSRLVFDARDPGALLHDTFIETARTYGSDSEPVAIETVMQSILDDNDTGVTLYVDGDPDFGIEEYELANVTVLDALLSLADLIGWSVRYKWNESASDFVLTLYEPDRTNTIAAYTFGPDDYYAVNALRLQRNGIRNAGKVVYTDDAGEEQEYPEERAGSIALYGRRFMLLDERGGAIRTDAEAARFLGAILDDLESPPAVQSIEAAFHWPAELGDVYTYSANDVHYDSDQKYATFAFRHVLSRDKRRTIIEAAGQPSGGYARWHAREKRRNEYESPENLLSLINFRTTDQDADTVTKGWTNGSRVNSVWVYLSYVELGTPPVWPTEGTLPTQIMVGLEATSEYAIARPTYGQQCFFQFEPRSVNATPGELRRGEIPALPVVVNVDLTATAAESTVDLAVQVSASAPAYPVSITVYENAKNGTEIASGTLTEDGSFTTDLTGLTRPATGSKNWYAKVVDRAGVEYWDHAFVVASGKAPYFSGIQQTYPSTTTRNVSGRVIDPAEQTGTFSIWLPGTDVTGAADATYSSVSTASGGYVFNGTKNTELNAISVAANETAFLTLRFDTNDGRTTGQFAVTLGSSLDVLIDQFGELQAESIANGFALAEEYRWYYLADDFASLSAFTDEDLGTNLAFTVDDRTPYKWNAVSLVWEGQAGVNSIGFAPVLQAGVIVAAHLSITTISEISEDIGIILAGSLQNVGGTAGMDLDAGVDEPFLWHPDFTLYGPGSSLTATFGGDLDAAGGTFAGTVTATDFDASSARFHDGTGGGRIEVGEGISGGSTTIIDPDNIRLGTASGSAGYITFDGSYDMIFEATGSLTPTENLRLLNAGGVQVTGTLTLDEGDITFGTANSGGSGYRVLRVPNA